MEHFYLHLSCEDSRTRYRENHAAEFIVDLPKTYYMEGEWECALTEMSLFSKTEEESLRLYVCCDMVEESYARNTLVPVLRSLAVTQNFTDIELSQPYYLKIRQSRVNRVRMFIRGEDLQPVRFKIDHLYCTLHCRRKWVR